MAANSGDDFLHEANRVIIFFLRECVCGQGGRREGEKEGKQNISK